MNTLVTKDESAILIVAIGEVEIGILRDVSSTLNYLPGSCSWITTLNIGGVFGNLTIKGQQRILEGTGTYDTFPLKCAVDGIDQLTALVIIFGRSEDYCGAFHIVFHCYHRDQ